MLELLIEKQGNEILTTNHGTFRILDEEYVVNEVTGEAFSVAGSTTDENGALCELMIE